MRRASCPLAPVPLVAPVVAVPRFAPFAPVAPVPWIEAIAWRCATLAVVGLLAAPGAGTGGSIRAQARPASVAQVAPPAPLERRAPTSVTDEPATAWLPTTDRTLTVLFSLNRDEEGCVAGCEKYKFWLRYAEPSRGAAPSAQWLDASRTSCVDYWVDGRPDVACSTFGEMAGRDRRGTDYVLLPMYSSRAQLDRMRRSHTLIFQFGDHAFHLTSAGRSALQRFLAESGGR